MAAPAAISSFDGAPANTNGSFSWRPSVESKNGPGRRESESPTDSCCRVRVSLLRVLLILAHSVECSGSSQLRV